MYEGEASGFLDVQDCLHPSPVVTYKRLGHSADPRRLKSRHFYGHRVSASLEALNLAAVWDEPASEPETEFYIAQLSYRKDLGAQVAPVRADAEPWFYG